MTTQKEGCAIVCYSCKKQHGQLQEMVIALNSFLPKETEGVRISAVACIVNKLQCNLCGNLLAPDEKSDAVRINHLKNRCSCGFVTECVSIVPKAETQQLDEYICSGCNTMVVIK